MWTFPALFVNIVRMQKKNRIAIAIYIWEDINMNVKSIERNGNQATITVEIEKELMETGAQKAYLKARKNIMIPGFRKGKAPRKMIEAMYGAHVFYEDGLEEIFPQVTISLSQARISRLSAVPA